MREKEAGVQGEWGQASIERKKYSKYKMLFVKFSFNQATPDYKALCDTSFKA